MLETFGCLYIAVSFTVMIILLAVGVRDTPPVERDAVFWILCVAILALSPFTYLIAMSAMMSEEVNYHDAGTRFIH